MNYYKQFAEMLGLELEQEFRLVKPDGTKVDNDLYIIRENGLFYKERKEDVWHAEPSTTLSSLLQGLCKVVTKPWKPEKGDEYWRCRSKCGSVSSTIWLDDVIDLCGWKSGNCFRTEEEAKTKGKEIMEKLVKEYEEA